MEQTIASQRTMEDLATEFETPDLEANAGEEVYVEQWGDEQRMLVEANQDVIVVCPWMDDAEVTLGTAMTTYEYPPNPTAEDEPFLISVVNELLANQAVKEEKPEDPVVEIEEEPVIADESQAELQENEKVQSEVPERKVIDDKVFKEAAEPAINKKQPPVQRLAKVRQQAEEPAVDIQKTPQPKTATETVTSRVATNVSAEQVHPSSPVVSEDESVTAPARREVEIEQPAEVLEVSEIVASEVAATPERTLIAELVRSQTKLDHETHDSSAESPSVEIPATPEPAVEAVEIERLTALAEEVALPTYELNGANEDQPAPLRTPDHFDNDEIEEVPGKEGAAVNQFAIPAAELIDEVAEVKERSDMAKNDELNRGAEVEDVIVEPPAEVDIVAGRVLAEYIERSNLQTAEVTKHYLDEIIELAAEVHVFEGEDTIEEVEMAEELEELFTELFDEMDVPYTPELIERLVCRTIEQRMAKNKELEDQEKTDDTRQASLGTVLKKPSAGNITLNDAITHNRLISKVALELCGFKISFSLN